MNITLDIADTVTVQIRKRALPVEAVALWPQISLDKVFAYGLQQLLNDAAAPAKSDEEIMPLVEKRIANLRDGVLRASPIRTADPVAKEALRIATQRVVDAAKTHGKEYTNAEIRQLAQKVLAKYPDITVTARANVERTNGLEVEVDLTDL